MLIRKMLLTTILLCVGSELCVSQELAPIETSVSAPSSLEQKMLSELSQNSRDKNFCFSPYGIQLVLSKLALIASPEARAEIVRAMDGKTPLALAPPMPSVTQTPNRLDLLAQDNDGYGVKVSQLSNDLLARNLSNGDLIFKINGQAVRGLKDFSQIIQKSNTREVELSGYSVKSGDVFVGIRVPVIPQSIRSREPLSEASSKTAMFFNPAVAENAQAFINTLPAYSDLKFFPLPNYNPQELLTFLGPGNHAPKWDRTQQNAMCLVNIVRVDGLWQYPFDGEVVEDFYGVKPSMQKTRFLERVATFEYTQQVDFEQVILPIRDMNVRMRIVVPQVGKFETVQASFCRPQIRMASATPTLLRVRIPKFEIRSQIAVLTWLDRFGLPTLASPDVRFPGLSNVNRLSLSAFDQHASVAFHAKGVHASAKTTATITGMGKVTGARELLINRPFLFAIEDPSGTILMAGQYVNVDGNQP